MNQKRFAILLTICLAVGSSVFGLSPATTESVRYLFSELMTIESSPSLEALRPRIEVHPLNSGASGSEEVGYKRLGSPVEQGPTLLSRSECCDTIVSRLHDRAALS